MAEVKTEYRGHVIRWSDNEDAWTCYDLSDKVRSSPKLSILKGHIDRLYLAERKRSATPCWELSSYSNGRTEGSVVEYLKAKEERSWSSQKVGRVQHIVAVVAQRSGSERPSRAEKDLDNLAPMTPEFDAAWAEFQRLHQLAKEAEKRARDAFTALPRLQLADVQKLVDLAQHTEGDAA